MTNKIHNKTLFVAALSVYFGLLIAGAPPHILAQQIEAQLKQEEASKINQRPLKDFARELEKQIVAGQVNLDNSCSVLLRATLENNGKLTNSKVVSQTSDAVLCGAAINFFSAVSDTGALINLKRLTKFAAVDATFSFKAHNGNFEFSNNFSLESIQEAQRLGSALNAVLIIHGLQRKEAGAKAQNVLRGTAIIVQEKEIKIVTNLPRADLDALLLKANEKAN